MYAIVGALATRRTAMDTLVKTCLVSFLVVVAIQAHAQTVQTVVDVPTRSGVSQRMLVLSPPEPKAAVVLFPGGHGGLQTFPNGSFKWGEGNFLVRSRQFFADQGLIVAIVDAPSDRQSPPFLSGFRQTPEHAADIKAVIAWLRGQAKLPVWLVGTSRGTQSAAYVAIELSGSDGPDGVVLSSTILTDNKGRPVPAMPLAGLRVPVLVVHHEQDGCTHCAFSDIPKLMEKLGGSSRKQLLSFKGGENRGDPCEAFAYHGFNGLEREVVGQTAAWILAK
jgi:pimeloyl-ACP methyl ester carboxylesterase